MNKETILLHYLMAAVFADAPKERSNDCHSITLDGFDEDFIQTAREDIDVFISVNKDVLIASKLADEQIGHDFWLTRNRHGAGFWDRGLGQIGEELTEAAQKFSELNVEEQEDGKFCIF